MSMKKAQLQSQPLNFLFALVILASIVVIGYKAINFFSNKSCEAKLIDMEVDLSDSAQLQATFTGSIRDKLYFLCDFDKLYIIDSQKDVSFAEFKDFPQIVNALKDKTLKNTFLIDNKEVAQDLYVAYLDLGAPYYLCLRPRNNRIELVLEGKGAGTKVSPKTGLYDCTFNNTPIELKIGRAHV